MSKMEKQGFAATFPWRSARPQQHFPGIPDPPADTQNSLMLRFPSQNGCTSSRMIIFEMYASGRYDSASITAAILSAAALRSCSAWCDGALLRESDSV